MLYDIKKDVEKIRNMAPNTAAIITDGCQKSAVTVTEGPGRQLTAEISTGNSRYSLTAGESTFQEQIISAIREAMRAEEAAHVRVCGKQ